MARPIKTELDYYQEDCSIGQVWELLSIKYGGVVYGIYYTVRNQIFAHKGYYLDWCDEFKLLHSGRFHIDYDILVKVIDEAIEKNIFDKELYEKYAILTSREIQQTYLYAAKKRKQHNILPEHCLLAKEEIAVYFKNNGVSGEETHVCGEETRVCGEETRVCGEETRVCGEETQHKIYNIDNNIDSNNNIYNNNDIYIDNNKNDYIYHDNNKIKESKEDEKKNEANPRRVYGRYNNIFLTREEYETLKKEHPDTDSILEHLSQFLLTYKERDSADNYFVNRYIKAGLHRSALPKTTEKRREEAIYETARIIEEKRKRLKEEAQRN